MRLCSGTRPSLQPASHKHSLKGANYTYTSRVTEEQRKVQSNRKELKSPEITKTIGQPMQLHGGCLPKAVYQLQESRHTRPGPLEYRAPNTKIDKIAMAPSM